MDDIILNHEERIINSSFLRLENGRIDHLVEEIENWDELVEQFNKQTQLERWLNPILIALSVSQLLATLIILTHHLYSRQTQRTKINLIPYYILLIYYIFEVISIVMATMQLQQKLSDVLTSFYTPLFSAFLSFKIVVFWTFVDFQRYECDIYKLFVDWQLNLSLEELPVRKREYQHAEAQSWTSFKTIHKIFFTGYVIIAVTQIFGLILKRNGIGSLIQEEQYVTIFFDQQVMIPTGYIRFNTITYLCFCVWTLLQAMPILLQVGSTYVAYTVTLFYYHRNVFKSHVRRIMLLRAIIFIALLLMVFFFFLLVFLLSCQLSTCIPLQNKLFNHFLAQNETDPDTQSSCGIGLTFFNHLYSYFGFLMVQTLVTCVTCWIVNISFLIVYKPHDCFKCLGKDPDRIYSIFQIKDQLANQSKYNSVIEKSLQIRSTQNGINLTQNSCQRSGSTNTQIRLSTLSSQSQSNGVIFPNKYAYNRFSHILDQSVSHGHGSFMKTVTELDSQYSDDDDDSDDHSNMNRKTKRRFSSQPGFGNPYAAKETESKNFNNQQQLVDRDSSVNLYDQYSDDEDMIYRLAGTIVEDRDSSMFGNLTSRGTAQNMLTSQDSLNQN